MICIATVPRCIVRLRAPSGEIAVIGDCPDTPEHIAKWTLEAIKKLHTAVPDPKEFKRNFGAGKWLTEKKPLQKHP